MNDQNTGKLDRTSTIACIIQSWFSDFSATMGIYHTGSIVSLDHKHAILREINQVRDSLKRDYPEDITDQDILDLADLERWVKVTGPIASDTMSTPNT
jgi:hypothetical protein